MATSKGMKFKQHTDEEILEALEKCGGLIHPTARLLDVDYRGLLRRINKNPKLQESVKDFREIAIDASESALFSAIKRQEPWAITLLLKGGLARNRGWGDFVTSINTNTNVNTEIDLSNLSMEELKVLNELLEKSTKSLPDSEGDI
jgi:hypothetical protein